MSETRPRYGATRESRRGWDAEGVRALRLRLGYSQQQFADELGVRQQTVSEWETGRYAPRGATARLLGIVAERAEIAYHPTVPVAASEPAAANELAATSEPVAASKLGTASEPAAADELGAERVP